MNDVAAVVHDVPKVADKINIVYGVIVGFFALIFGEHWVLFAGFLALNVVDYATGTYKGRVKNELSSSMGYRGALRKVSYWIVIGIAFFIARSFVEMGEIVGVRLDFVILFGWLTLAMYLVNEIRSILENLVEIGVEVPFFLVKGLDITKKLLEAEAEKEAAREDSENQS